MDDVELKDKDNVEVEAKPKSGTTMFSWKNKNIAGERRPIAERANWSVGTQSRHSDSENENVALFGGSATIIKGQKDARRS